MISMLSRRREWNLAVAGKMEAGVGGVEQHLARRFAPADPVLKTKSTATPAAVSKALHPVSHPHPRPPLARRLETTPPSHPCYSRVPARLGKGAGCKRNLTQSGARTTEIRARSSARTKPGLGTILWAIDENTGTNLQVLYSSSAIWKHKNS